MPISTVSMAMESVIDVVSVGDVNIKNSMIKNMPTYWSLASLSRCSPTLIRLYAQHYALIDATAMARNEIDRLNRFLRSESKTKFDSINRAESKRVGDSQGTSYGESNADSHRDSSRRTFSDSNGYSSASDTASSNSRSDGYDRGTRSSFSDATSSSFSNSNENGTSSQNDTDQRSSNQKIKRILTRGTRGFTERSELSIIQVATVWYENGSTGHSHTATNASSRDAGSNFVKTESHRRSSSSSSSGSGSSDKITAGSSEVHSAHQDGESHNRADGKQGSESARTGESHASGTMDGDNQAHSEGQSTSHSESSGSTHADSGGDGESFSTGRTKVVYYSQLFESLRAMAKITWQEIEDIERLVASALPTVVGQLKYNRPGLCGEPRYSKKQITSPCGPPPICVVP